MTKIPGDDLVHQRPAEHSLDQGTRVLAAPLQLVHEVRAEFVDIFLFRVPKWLPIIVLEPNESKQAKQRAHARNTGVVERSGKRGEGGGRREGFLNDYGMPSATVDHIFQPRKPNRSTGTVFVCECAGFPRRISGRFAKKFLWHANR